MHINQLGIIDRPCPDLNGSWAKPAWSLDMDMDAW